MRKYDIRENVLAIYGAREIDYSRVSCFAARRDLDKFYVRRVVNDNLRLLREAYVARSSSEQFNLRSIISAFVSSWFSAIVVAGEPVGIVAAQSIGELQTQANLNTFHTAGKGGAVATDSVENIINVNGNNDKQKMVVYAERAYSDPSEFRRDILRELVCVYVRDLISSTRCVDLSKRLPVSNHHKTTGKRRATVSIDMGDGDRNTYRFSLNYKVMAKYSISEREILSFIDSSCSFIDLRIYRTDGHIEFSVYDYGQFSTTGLSKRFSGISQIIGGDIKYDDHVESYYAELIGSDLCGVLGVIGVDSTRTTTTAIEELQHMMGIATARSYMRRAMRRVAGSIYVSHVDLVVDKMCATGDVLSVSRYSVRCSGVGTLAKASFEESVDIISKSAMTRQRDDLTSVSSAVTMGRSTRIGTNAIEIIVT